MSPAPTSSRIPAPRLAIVRSTMCAITSATAMVMPAAIQSWLVVASAVYKWTSGMAIEATPARTRAIASVRDSEAVRVALRIGLSSRMAVLLVAIFAALSFGPASGGLARENADKFDEPALTHAIADPVLAPLARWDSVWYLTIADSGYGKASLRSGHRPLLAHDSSARAAFFPLYPLLVRGVGTLFGGSH